MEKQAQKKPQFKHFPWKRLVISMIIFLFIIVIIVLNIQGSKILAVLGVVFALLQWLFPLSLEKHETHTTHFSTTENNSQTSSSASPATSNITSSSTLGALSSITREDSMEARIPILNVGHPEVLQTRSDTVFLFNEQLTDPREFYGRVREHRTLISRTSNGASTSIVGSRRIGKTWLMTYLRLVSSTELGTHFKFAFVDATSASCSTVTGFMSKVLDEFGVHVFMQEPTNLELVTLERVVQKLKTKGQNPVLCIDEFEGFGNHQAFNVSFFTSLRAMTQAGLCLVVASKTPLIDIVGDYGKTSGFFNIFEQLTLKPFNFKEAEAFARDKSAQAGFTEQERAYLLKYGKIGQLWPPIRLQLVGKMLLEDKNWAGEDVDYSPNDPVYWREFEERLEEKYHGVVR